MAFAEIRYGADGVRGYIDGVETFGGEWDEWRSEHKAMEEWSFSSSSGTEWREWPRNCGNPFAAIGHDVQLYRVRSVSVNAGEITHDYWYACGDTKAKVERDFDQLVAPVIKRDAPEAMPARGKLAAVGLLDPRKDDFVWPKYVYNESPPCIELQRDCAKTMPIRAIMHPVWVKGWNVFRCEMRYGGTGRLVKAKCSIIRRGQWDVDVKFNAAGQGRVTSVRRQ